ncbi:hypothetical protein IFM89_015781 [Coptis chinensis]|uniref:COP1-interacting protein 7 n=1 Tax=Coptis chinensis TaxID=261450 RepID=A0A835IP67_9MAGN|nr:hypothetical protein IFM89_015781 [Coptis chinensis]
MDSSTRLAYVLFQLTPTRTRCDLVVFTGSNKKEKIASGLFEPFITHLKYAKEQIPKGGYSITLRPPLPDSSWFTKGTLERFVQFVSTLKVLERFVTIKNEITQIENSIQANKILNNDVTVQTEEAKIIYTSAKKLFSGGSSSSDRGDLPEKKKEGEPRHLSVEGMDTTSGLCRLE